MFGPLLGFDPFEPSKWGCWAKIHGTHNAPLFPFGESDLPQLEKYCIFFYIYSVCPWVIIRLFEFSMSYNSYKRMQGVEYLSH